MMERRIKPTIFIPKEGNRTLIEVLLEQHDNFDIYWYHWPWDGIFRIGDYEPIILIYSNKKTLCHLVIRRGWDYKHYEFNILDQSIEIIFEGPFHHPYAKKLDNNEEYHEKKKILVEGDYDPRIINSDQIPIRFRTGEGHITSLGRIVEDPVDNAKETYSDYCM